MVAYAKPISEQVGQALDAVDKAEAAVHLARLASAAKEEGFNDHSRPQTGEPFTPLSPGSEATVTGSGGRGGASPEADEESAWEAEAEHPVSHAAD
jgi:hypothetical protein